MVDETLISQNLQSGGQEYQNNENQKQDNLISEFQIPASLDLALKHRKDSVPGELIKDNESNQLLKKMFFPFFKRHRNLESPNYSIALYLQFSRFCLVMALVMLLMQLRTILTHRFYSCKFYFEIQKPKQRCSVLDLNGYLLSPFVILPQVAQNGNLADLNQFSEALKLDMLIMIGQVVIVSSLPFIFVFFQFRLIKKLKKKQKKLCVSDYTIMVTDFDKEELERMDFEEYFTSLLQQAGFAQKVKVLKVETMTTHHSIKEMEQSLSEDRFQRKFIKKVLLEEKFTKKEKLKLSKLKKKVQKSIVKLSSKIEKKKKTEFKKNIGFLLLSSPLTRDKVLTADSEAFSRGFWIFRMCRTKRSKFRLWLAPEPNQIVWKNIGYSMIKKCLVQVLLIGLTALVWESLLFITNTILQSLFYSASFNILPKRPPKSVIFLSRAVVIFTNVFYELCSWITKKIDYKIFCYSLFNTKDISSGYRANLLALLKQLTFFPDVGVAYVQFNFNESNKEVKFAISSTLAYMTFISNQIIFQGVLRLLRLRHISKYIKMIWYGCFQRKKRIMMPQKQLNEIFERPKCEIEVMHSMNIYILLVMLKFSFYTPVMTVLCLIYFLTNMVVDRFLLYRFYAEPDEKKKNLAQRLLLSSGFMLKVWFYHHIDLTSYQVYSFSTFKIIGELGLYPWIGFMKYFFIASMLSLLSS